MTPAQALRAAGEASQQVQHAYKSAEAAIEAAYVAGQVVMRERAARAAFEVFPEAPYPVECETAHSIAAAIRALKAEPAA